MAEVVALEIRLKCGVFPLMTHPSAKKASHPLIFFDITNGRPSEMASGLRKQGILVGERVGVRWRMVTHHNITTDDVDHTLRVFNSLFS